MKQEVRNRECDDHFCTEIFERKLMIGIKHVETGQDRDHIGHIGQDSKELVECSHLAGGKGLD